MKALILGCLGQDGSYLAEQLVDAGHKVWGMIRPRSYSRLGWIAPLVADQRMSLVEGDLLDQASLEKALQYIDPDEVYNLAAVTAPGAAWGCPQPPLLADVTAMGVLHLLEAMRLRAPSARLVHASSSAIYDPGRYGLYGAAKLFAHELVVGYRTGVGLHASNAVLFSHTSPRQSPTFLARAVTETVARIAAGLDTQLVLSNVDNRRDWGYAPDYTRALALMAEQKVPGDYVITTGRRHSVRELAEVALAAAGLDWTAVKVTNMPAQPAEVWKSANHTRFELGWEPHTTFEEMIQLMVAADVEALS